MATAIPHPLASSPLPSGGDDVDFFPIDDLSRLPPEFRAGIEQGEADIRAGRVVSHAEVQKAIEEMRLRGA